MKTGDLCPRCRRGRLQMVGAGNHIYPEASYRCDGYQCNISAPQGDQEAIEDGARARAGRAAAAEHYREYGGRYPEESK